MANEKMFCIEGELLHKLKDSPQEKNYCVKIGNKQFKDTKIQLLFFLPLPSNISFIMIIHSSLKFLLI
jgi:hypothetical protein